MPNTDISGETVKQVVKHLVYNLIDSENQEGCTPDVTVISTKELKELTDYLSIPWVNSVCPNHLKKVDNDGYCDECGYQ